MRRIPGIDGRIYLDFSERFELNLYLHNNLTNWKPDKVKKVLLMKKDGSSFSVRISTISDRCWQTVVKYALSPAHEALFSYRNFGFRFYNDIFDLQNILMLNLSKESFGIEKRFFLFDFSNCSGQIDISYLLKKLFLPRSIKLGIFRLTKFGFLPEFFTLSSLLNLSSLLSNVAFSSLDYFHSSVRVGNNIIFFLKPYDNEFSIIKKVNCFLTEIGLNFSYSCKILSPVIGFNFLDWNFSLSSDKNIVCIPSFQSYQIFLRRVKRIINNSNYGANIKCLKLFPIIRDWRFYNRFVTLESLKFSLFFIKKRAFKVFNSESKQDQYSTKFLINKCFNFDLPLCGPNKDSFILEHITFWSNSPFNFDFLNDHKIQNFCIHCGSKVYLHKDFL